VKEERRRLLHISKKGKKENCRLFIYPMREKRKEERRSYSLIREKEGRLDLTKKKGGGEKKEVATPLCRKDTVNPVDSVLLLCGDQKKGGEEGKTLSARRDHPARQRKREERECRSFPKEKEKSRSSPRSASRINNGAWFLVVLFCFGMIFCVFYLVGRFFLWFKV